MIEKRYDSLAGLSAPILVYADVAEAEAVVAGGLLNEANNNMVYRGVLPTVRDTICTLVETETGVERESKVVGKTKAGKDIVQWEADGKYVNRVLAEKGLEDFKSLQPQLDALCRAFQDEDDVKNGRPGTPLAVDLKGTERKAAGPKKLAAKYKQSAAVVITRGTVDRVNSVQLAKINKTFTATNDTSKMFTGKASVPTGQRDEAGKPVYSDVDYNVSDKDAEALGWLLKDYADWKSTQDMLEVAAG